MVKEYSSPPSPHKEHQDWLTRGLVEIRGRHLDSTEASQAAYDRLHGAGHLQQQDSFYKWLVSLSHASPGQSLLDVSCGQGGILKFATIAHLETFGLDFSLQAVRRVRELDSRLAATVGDAEHLPFGDHSFDHVYNIGSLEHYFHPGHAVQEMSRVLKPDGTACILLPNTFGLLGNIIHVWRTGDVFDDGQPLQRYGTLKQWQNLLEQNGLCIIRVVKYERAWPRTWADLRWYCLRPYRLVRVALSTLIPISLSSFLVFLCRKTN